VLLESEAELEAFLQAAGKCKHINRRLTYLPDWQLCYISHGRSHSFDSSRGIYLISMRPLPFYFTINFNNHATNVLFWCGALRSGNCWIIFYDRLSEDSTGPTDNTLVQPKAGNMYIYTTTRYDTSGTPTSTTTDTVTILSTGVTSGGLTDLMAVWRSSIPNDTVFARYESNGDFAFYFPIDTNSDDTPDGFRTDIYPVGSKARLQLEIDTLFDSGNAYTVSIDSIYYVNDASLSVPAGNFTASTIVDVNDHRSYTESGTYWSRVREISTQSFVPSIGFFAKVIFEHEQLDTTGALLKRTLFTRMELKSYLLK
jgi:hypothetical protein